MKKKTLSCGGLIFCGKELLICRPRWDSDDWNLPKGMKEEGEEDLETALREIQEETNIVIDRNCKKIDHGIRKWHKTKNVHLYSFFLCKKPTNIKCNSYFERNGKSILEMVDFDWIPIDEIKSYFSPKLGKVVYELAKRSI